MKSDVGKSKTYTKTELTERNLPWVATGINIDVRNNIYRQLLIQNLPLQIHLQRLFNRRRKSIPDWDIRISHVVVYISVNANSKYNKLDLLTSKQES